MSIPASSPVPAVIIGGGISGLACAHRLGQSGISTLVLEAGVRPGGVIGTVEREGFQFELGPQSFLSTDPLLDLIDALGLKEKVLRANPEAPRYILSDGKLVAAPLSPPALLTTPLLGARSKWRVYSEISGRTRPPEEDESIAAFVRRKFGDEVLNQLAAPFISGIYAGDPERLSLRAAFPKLHEFEASEGSVLRGALKAREKKGARPHGLCSFLEGMKTLPQSLAASIGDRFLPETTVVAVRRVEAGGQSYFEVDIARNHRQETIATRAVVIATPTDAASQMLRTLSDQFPPAFAQIEYAPVAVVSTGYRLDRIRQPIDGFGFLAPRTEGLRVLGTVFSSSLFPGRAPEGMACLASFAGGATDPKLCEQSDDEIAQTIGGELAKVLRISGDPVFTDVRRYARGLPQYNLGYAKVIAELSELTSSIPGLFLAGNYLTGPSIGACVEQSNQTADSLRAYLGSPEGAGESAVAHG